MAYFMSLQLCCKANVPQYLAQQFVWQVSDRSRQPLFVARFRHGCHQSWRTASLLLNVCVCLMGCQDVTVTSADLQCKAKIQNYIFLIQKDHWVLVDAPAYYLPEGFTTAMSDVHVTASQLHRSVDQPAATLRSIQIQSTALFDT